jgi:hypothetical protein
VFGAAYKVLFNADVSVITFLERSLNIIILTISQSAVIPINKIEVERINFLKFSEKKKSANGIISKKAIAVSFDSKASKKQIPPKAKADFDFVETYLKRNRIDRMAKRKQRISSRLFMLFTTSV